MTYSVDDMIGKKFGLLTVISRIPERRNGRVYWSLRCDCGQPREAQAKDLRSGKTKSCGCLRGVRNRQRLLSHGHTGTKTYAVWASMVQRCTNPNQKAYAWYGGAGKGVCERWLSFDNFLADMGECPDGGSIDRINNDLGYSPENCRWIPRSEQSRNRQCCNWYYYKMRWMRIWEIAEETGLDTEFIRRRMDVSRMTLYEAVTVPIGKTLVYHGDHI